MLFLEKKLLPIWWTNTLARIGAVCSVKTRGGGVRFAVKRTRTRNKQTKETLVIFFFWKENSNNTLGCLFAFSPLLSLSLSRSLFLSLVLYLLFFFLPLPSWAVAPRKNSQLRFGKSNVRILRVKCDVVISRFGSQSRSRKSKKEFVSLVTKFLKIVFFACCFLVPLPLFFFIVPIRAYCFSLPLLLPLFLASSFLLFLASSYSPVGIVSYPWTVLSV